jgi:hypothetical protein
MRPGLEAVIVNTWPTKSTPDIIQPLPYVPLMHPERAVELLKEVRKMEQPVNLPTPRNAVLQFPRYYIIGYNWGRITIRGVKRLMLPTAWYAEFDVRGVADHGYWHPAIIDFLLAVLESK